MSLNISEAFYSIQGEGPSAGTPAYFIRLQGCNLVCGGPAGRLVAEGKATWHCDTEKVWREGKKVYNEELEEMIEEADILDEVLGGKIHLIWTGGEPCMEENEKGILDFFDYMNWKYRKINLYNEVETNATIVAKELFSRAQQINASPKLSNSGMRKDIRINPNHFQYLMSNHYDQTWFKFVISSEEDIKEIKEDVLPFIVADKIYLMPAVDKQEDLPKMTKLVWEFAMREGWKMCSRLHILAFDQLTGV